jgi:hypothetical protein
VDSRELISQQEVEDEGGVSPVILLPALRQPPDLGRVADEYLMAEPLDEFDKPGTVPAGFDPDDHLAREAEIEATDIIPLMTQFSELDRPVGRIAVANSLLTRVKVDSTINSHGHLLAVSCAR